MGHARAGENRKENSHELPARARTRRLHALLRFRNARGVRRDQAGIVGRCLAHHVQSPRLGKRGTRDSGARLFQGADPGGRFSGAYKRSRSNVGKILAHIGAVSEPQDGDFCGMVDRLIADRNGRFHFGSLVRCTVERFDQKKRCWKGSGGGMLDKFMGSEFGMEVAGNCAERFLGSLPAKTKLVVMFGLGAKLNYVRAARKLVENARPGNWRQVNEVAYTDGNVTFVHVEHFASQGHFIPDWLGENDDPRAEYGHMAREAAQAALGA